jgi:hypothetical protein
LFDRAHYAEATVLGETLADHLFVTRFEDVQGQRGAGKQDDIEREQGDQSVQEVSGGEHGHVLSPKRARTGALRLIVSQRLTSRVTEE